MWAAQYCDFRAPRLWLTSGSMGTMGFGLPAAIGAQIANPNRLVIDIDGDSSIRMNVGELETVTTYDLPVKVVVLNNFGDGMVKQWQKLFHKGRLSASDRSLHKKDFVKAAQADGFRYAVRLDRKEDVPRVIEEFMKFDGPAFLEVMIDRDAGVYPMVGPGQAYEDMITGDLHPVAPQGRDQDARPVGNVLIMKYLHTMVRVTDLDASLKFYCDALGLREVARKEVPQGRFTLVFLAAPGDDDAQVELTHNWDPEAVHGRPQLRPSRLRRRRHLCRVPAPAGSRRHHQSPAARRAHGVRPLARQHFRRAAAEGRRAAAGGAVEVHAQHRAVVAAPKQATPSGKLESHG